jgi:glyoxalase family protein
MKVHGIHHITAIASNPVECVEFYTKVLGLRLVKRSINQDQTEAYHLFFGDTTGEPGMDLTFFTFHPVISGSRGSGAVTMTSLAVPSGSLEYWQERLHQNRVVCKSVEKRFGKKRMLFYDRDNQQLELVELAKRDYEQVAGELWSKRVPKQKAIASFHSARLCVESVEQIRSVMEKVLKYEQVEEQGAIRLYYAGSGRGGYIELEESPQAMRAQNGAGSVHHIAFRVGDEEEQFKLRERVVNMGLNPTEVIDRYYFKSVYFRTEAGILFELATDGPGFTVDEARERLGSRLALPPFLESQRREIEEKLPVLE